MEREDGPDDMKDVLSPDSATGNQGEETEKDVKLSKRQQKRLEKKEKIAQMRPIWRSRYRENLKKRKAEAKERGDDITVPRKALKKNTMSDSSCSIKVVIDCSFDDLMNEKEIISLGQQIQRCYSVNRRLDNPLQLYVGGFNGKIKERLESFGAYKQWDINIKEESYHEFLEKDSIVYLSSESPNVLNDLDPDKAYIIGGLVDHNKHKGLCHGLAVEKNIKHAQLPIGEFIKLKGRKVLTIDHVFEILATFTETKNWEESFSTVLPKRKEVVSISSTNDADTPKGKDQNSLELNVDHETRVVESVSCVSRKVTSVDCCDSRESKPEVGPCHPISDQELQGSKSSSKESLTASSEDQSKSTHLDKEDSLL